MNLIASLPLMGFPRWLSAKWIWEEQTFSLYFFLLKTMKNRTFSTQTGRLLFSVLFWARKKGGEPAANGSRGLRKERPWVGIWQKIVASLRYFMPCPGACTFLPTRLPPAVSTSARDWPGVELGGTSCMGTHAPVIPIQTQNALGCGHTVACGHLSQPF